MLDGAGFAPGQFVKLDEDDYSTAEWVACPRWISGEAPLILATDRLVWPIRMESRHGVCLCPGGCRGSVAAAGRLSEIKEVVSVQGQRHHLLDAGAHHGTRPEKAAQLTRYTGRACDARSLSAGVEDSTLTGGSEGNLSFSAAAYSWAKNIECTGVRAIHVSIPRTRFDSRFATPISMTRFHPYPGGGGYALSLPARHGPKSLIENNIIMGANKVMVVRSAGAGSVVGYNYAADGRLHRKRPRVGWRSVSTPAT